MFDKESSDKWLKEERKRPLPCVSQFLSGALKLCREAPSGPWEWVACDSSMLMLTERGDEMEGSLMWASRCHSCAESADKEKDPKRQHLCGWPDEGVAKFIAASRTILPAALFALSQSYNWLKTIRDDEEMGEKARAKAAEGCKFAENSINAYWDRVRS